MGRVIPACPLCEGVAPARFTVRGFVVHRCAPCDLEFVWPTPSEEVVRAVYATGYFTGAGAGYDDYFGRERSIARRKSQARLDALEALGHAGGRLLDVGCAAGYFVDDARARGWDSFGVEPSPEARRGLAERVTPYVLSSLDEARGPFDVVTFWDVLEHLPDPLATLREARALLRPGGTLGVVVPVLGSTNTRLAPRTWDQYKPPEHLWFFSRSAMRAALRLGAGAEVVREEVAWARAARFVDPDGRSKSPLVRALRALDAGLHAIVRRANESLVTDSVAFYARVP